LRDAPDDASRAKIIADAFEQLEDRYPNLKDMATQAHLRETELRLQKEIKEIEGRLQIEIREIKTVGIGKCIRHIWR
jgi:molecular chaperone GrpE (heat shock protein)